MRIACPPGPAREVLESSANTWAYRVGQERPEFLDRDAAESADIVAIRPWELGRWASLGLTPLHAELLANPKLGWSRLFPLYKDKLLLWGGRPFALPLVTETPMLVWRTDAFAKPPATWQEILEVAQGRPTRPPPLPPLPKDADAFDAAFFQVAAPLAQQAESDARFNRGAVPPDVADRIFSFQYNLSTGEPRIDDPGFVAALTLLQKMQPLRPAERAEQPADAFRRADAIVAVVSLADLARLAEPDSPVQNKFRVASLPAARINNRMNSVPYLGAAGWFAVVPESSKQSAAAFDLLVDVAGQQIKPSKTATANPRLGGGLTRPSQLDAGAELWSNYGLSGALRAELKEVLTTLAETPLVNPAIRLRTPDQESHHRALVEEVSTALEKGTAPAEALAAVRRRWDTLDQMRPQAERLADLRRSVGLVQ